MKPLLQSYSLTCRIDCRTFVQSQEIAIQWLQLKKTFKVSICNGCTELLSFNARIDILWYFFRKSNDSSGTLKCQNWLTTFSLVRFGKKDRKHWHDLTFFRSLFARNDSGNTHERHALDNNDCQQRAEIGSKELFYPGTVNLWLFPLQLHLTFDIVVNPRRKCKNPRATR